MVGLMLSSTVRASLQKNVTKAVRFYDRDGSPLEVLEWARRYDDAEYCSVARDEVGGWTVGTVWHGYPAGVSVLAELLRRDDSYRPIFASGLMAPVVAADGSPFLLTARSYDDEASARRGHALLVEWLSRPGVVPLVAESTIDALFLASMGR